MKYVSLTMVSFGAGALLGLSVDQSAARTASIAPVPGRKGWFTTTGPVQFKRGEEFQFDGELPKAMAQHLETPAEKARAVNAARSAAAALVAKEAKELAAEARAKAEPDARAKWDQDEALRKQFSDDFEAYLTAELKAG